VNAPFASPRFLTLARPNGGPVLVNLALVQWIWQDGDERVCLRYADETLTVGADFDRLATLISWEPDWSEVAGADRYAEAAARFAAPGDCECGHAPSVHNNQRNSCVYCPCPHLQLIEVQP
jgi:hypothetical protein